jgi:hypothetical protein
MTISSGLVYIVVQLKYVLSPSRIVTFVGSDTKIPSVVPVENDLRLETHC